MFAALEHRERTAHFPSPGDWSGCVALWREIFTRYNSAMLAGDTTLAKSIDDEAELLVLHIHGEQLGSHDSLTRLAEATIAEAGSVPLWGQSGTFRIEFHGIPVDIEIEGLRGLAHFSSLLPHFSINVVDRSRRRFLSSTGYRSCFSHLCEAVEGMTLEAAVRTYLEAYFVGELKGKMQTCKTDAEHEAERAATRAAISRSIGRRWTGGDDEADEGPRPSFVAGDDDEAEDEQLEPSCCDCGVLLAQLDEFHECDEDGGERCPECFAVHRANCVECGGEPPVDEADDDEGELLLPSFEAVPAERAEASAVALGERLTGELLAPIASISRRTGRMESHSPLFANSAANPQGSLF